MWTPPSGPIGTGVWVPVGAALLIMFSSCTSALPHGSRTTTRHAPRPSVEITGFRWSQVQTKSAPPPRVMAQMAYDTASAQLILVGGERQVETQSTPIIKATALDDTWVLLGTTWIRLHPITSPPKEPLTAAYDPANRQLILIAAPLRTRAGRVLPSTTWTWRGRTWSRLAGMTPNPGTNGEDMAYDSATRQLVFVGGGTWVLRDSKWRRVSVLQPMITAIAFDPLSDRLVGGSSQSERMWWWDGRQWREYAEPPSLELNPVYNPEPSANWVTDTAVNEIFVEGDCGFTPSGKQAYACTWSGDVWVPILTASTPAIDNPENFSLAYDPPLHAVVAFGGDQGVRTPAGDWIVGGSQTWFLTHG